MLKEFEEVKINVRSLLTSSKSQLSIEQLLKDYREQEGENLPYKRLGFNSVIDLLQNMKDILTLPQNPNCFSTLSLIVDDKTSHLRNLVIKQKSTIKKKKKALNHNENYRNNKNNNTNEIHLKNKFCYNTKQNSDNIKNNKYKENMSQNTGNNCYKSNTYSQTISSSSSNLSSTDTSQNEVQSLDFIADELQSHLEKNVSENQVPITKEKLKTLVSCHPDVLSMKTNREQDVANYVENTFNITEKGISFVDTNDNNLNTSNTLSNSSSINELYSQNILKSDHSSDLDYIEVCKKQSMIGKLQDQNISYNEDKNLDIVQQDIKNNSKQQSKIKIKKYAIKEFSNEIKSNCSSDILYDTSSLNDLKKVSRSISQINKQDNHDDIVNDKMLHKSQCVPKEILFNIAKIFMIYRDGVNIENYIFIYYKVYHSIFDPVAYGFTSVLQLFKFLHEMVEIRNNVLYTKNEFMYSELNENIFKNDNILAAQKNIIHRVSLNNKLEISLNVEQQPFVNDGSELIMALVEAYNPSLFYLQLEYKIVELNHLMHLMQNFYADENSNYFIQPEHILPASIYASSYTTYSKQKQWYRVKVLREVNLKIVEVFHVDYGTVDKIPKTELRFLKNDFCHLPCQAIQCCLTGYNQLETISPEVSKSFVEIIDNKSLVVQIDKSYILSKDCSIFHVTLFYHSDSQDLENLKSINDELTIRSIQW